MCKKYAAILFFISPLVFANNICELNNNPDYKNLITSPQDDSRRNKVVCFNSNEISEGIIKSIFGNAYDISGVEIIDTYKSPRVDDFFVSLHDDLKGFSYVTGVSVSKANRPETYSGGIVNSKMIQNSDPEGTFLFTPSDSNNNDVYLTFSEPSKNTVYRLHRDNGAFHLSKIGSGYGEWVQKNGSIVVSREEMVSGKGRVSYGAIIDKNGNEMCRVESQSKGWALFAKCP